MSTPQDLLNAAYGMSKRFQPGATLGDAEALQLIIRVQRTFFTIAARINPTFFGSTSDVPYAAPGWARPATAELIYKLSLVAGSDLAVVPFTDLTAALDKPAVYRFGQVYRPAGNPLDPTAGSGSVRFWYSKQPTPPATLAGALDTLWPSNYDQLLIHELAVYMALKDGALGDLASAFVAERDHWLRLYLAFLEHETVGEVRNFSNLFNTPTQIPLQDLLAGGTSVKLSAAA
jgi:hypothetical protein